MNKLLSAITLLGITLSACSTTPTMTPKGISEVESNAILKTGFEHVERAIALRNKLAKDGVDFYKAKHIPELAGELPILAAYYRLAVKDKPKQKVLVEKVLKQMEVELKNKSMSLHKWNLFHEQFNTLFSPSSEVSLTGFTPGKLNFKMPSYETFSKSFPCFAYVNDGVLGLQTLNFAFANDIMILAMPTGEHLMADGFERNASGFTIHDAAHFSSFRSSSYFFKRFNGKALALYDAIEKQTSTTARIQDHLVYFMLIHEFPFSGSGYLASFEQLLHDGASTFVSSMRYSFPTAFDQHKQLVFNAVRSEDIFEQASIKIDTLPNSEYLITGKLTKAPATLRSIIACVKGKNEKGQRIVEFKDLQGKTIVVPTAGSQYDDLIPLLELLNEPQGSEKTPLKAASRLQDYSRQFLNKYARAEA